jgi:hypothetical protein
MSDARGVAVGFGAALAEQLRWFWHRLGLWIVVVTVLTAGAAAWIIATIPEEFGPYAYILVGSAFHPLLVLIALSWAFSAWRDDPPKDRQYFWLHPVERTSHTIARSLAAFIWLMVVLAIVIAVVVVVTQATIGIDMLGPALRLWAYSFAAIVLAYLAASIAPMLSDRPGFWVIGVIALVIILGAIATIREIEWLQEAVSWLQGGPRSFGTALGAPGSEAARLVTELVPAEEVGNVPGVADAASDEPAVALAIWLPISLAAWLAAARLSLPR